MIVASRPTDIGSSQLVHLAGSFRRRPGAHEKLHYIFGYGSLIEMESRIWTCPTAKYAFPAVAKGIRRGWNDRGTRPGFNTTFLGAARDPDATCVGAIFAVSALEFAQFVQRESGYDAQRLDPDDLSLLSGGEVNHEAEYYLFLNKTYQQSDASYPIVQSYLDVCLTGCLEFEAMYPLAKGAGFARQFVETIGDWTGFWINDRVHPRRPVQDVPYANEIDNILLDTVPDYFDKIRLA